MADITVPPGTQVQDEGILIARRTKQNFTGAGVTVTDDATNNRVDITIAGGASASSSVSSETSFGVAASAGTASTYSKGDHTHGSPTDPTTAHVAAADPHTGYRLESADHTHQSTGAAAGQLDHGLALTGLTDDDHTQYVLHTEVDDTPVDGVTTDPVSSNWAYDHVAASDPHTGYRLESADHSHQSTGAQAGKIDHGAALDGLTDDDHTQYLLADGTRTLTGVNLLGENAGFQLDTALSLDGKYSGIVEAGTAGAALAFGDLVYLAVADSRWELTDASAEATAFGKLGICVLAAAGDASATTVLLWGKVRADTAFPTLTVGAPVFISETAGDITNTAPVTAASITRIIGYGNTADELFFCPDPTYLEHT